MKTLLITGGIGSGKTTVCSIFAEKGIPVYDSDSRTKSLYNSSALLKDTITSVFGVSVYDNGFFNREAMAKLVFSDKDKLEILESIVHPLVKEDFIKWRDGYKSASVPFAILESAVVMKKPVFIGTYDLSLTVQAPLHDRVDRTSQRDGLSRDEVMKRICIQQPEIAESAGSKQDKFAYHTDYYIVNDGNIQELTLKVNKLYNIICKNIVSL